MKTRQVDFRGIERNGRDPKKAGILGFFSDEIPKWREIGLREKIE